MEQSEKIQKLPEIGNWGIERISEQQALRETEYISDLKFIMRMMGGLIFKIYDDKGVKKGVYGEKSGLLIAYKYRSAGRVQQFTTLENAVRFLYLKTQENNSFLKEIINTVLHETFESDEKFNLGKDVWQTILFKNFGYKATLHKNIRPGTEQANLYWAIRDKKGDWIASFWEDGKIQVKKSGSNMFGHYSNDWGLQDFNGDLNAAIKYVWLNRQKQKNISENQEEVEFKNVPIGKLITFPDIENWGARGIRWNQIYIYSDVRGRVKGKIEYDELNKETRIFYGEDEHGKWTHIESWPKFGNVKNAVRYVYLQSQKPANQLSEVTRYTELEEGELVKFPQIGNWSAKKVRHELVIIFNNKGHERGRIEKEGQKAFLTYYSEIDKKPHAKNWNVGDFINNIDEVVRFVYMQNQKQKVVDEIVSTGEGDLENYFKENPPALNNDYVDNYLDKQDYYISDKFPSRIPSIWN